VFGGIFLVVILFHVCCRLFKGDDGGDCAPVPDGSGTAVCDVLSWNRSDRFDRYSAICEPGAERPEWGDVGAVVADVGPHYLKKVVVKGPAMRNVRAEVLTGGWVGVVRET